LADMHIKTRACNTSASRLFPYPVKFSAYHYCLINP